MEVYYNGINWNFDNHFRFRLKLDTIAVVVSAGVVKLD